MSWREIGNDQNLRLAAKLLEQQGEINDLKNIVARQKEAIAGLAEQIKHPICKECGACRLCESWAFCSRKGEDDAVAVSPLPQADR
jgi:hypothetical protein